MNARSLTSLLVFGLLLAALKPAFSQVAIGGAGSITGTLGRDAGSLLDRGIGGTLGAQGRGALDAELGAADTFERTRESARRAARGATDTSADAASAAAAKVGSIADAGTEVAVAAQGAANGVLNGAANGPVHGAVNGAVDGTVATPAGGAPSGAQLLGAVDAAPGNGAPLGAGREIADGTSIVSPNAPGATPRTPDSAGESTNAVAPAKAPVAIAPVARIPTPAATEATRDGASTTNRSSTVRGGAEANVAVSANAQAQR